MPWEVFFAEKGQDAYALATADDAFEFPDRDDDRESYVAESAPNPEGLTLGPETLAAADGRV